MVLALALAGCASGPKTVDIPIAIPCPERPVIERPVLDVIPDDAADDMAVVTTKRNMLKLMQYAAQLEKIRGC